MKFTKEQFRDYILQEAKKMLENEENLAEHGVGIGDRVNRKHEEAKKIMAMSDDEYQKYKNPSPGHHKNVMSKAEAKKTVDFHNKNKS